MLEVRPGEYMVSGDISLEPYQMLGPDGELRAGAEVPMSDEEMVRLYRWMQFCRIYDQRCINLQRQGRMGTYAPLSGQEAAQTGSAAALRSTDWIFPSYRDHAATMLHGLPVPSVMLYWMGREEGNVAPEGVNIFPASVPIGTQMLHATGAAMAAKLQGNDDVFMTYFGDGATSEGDFHEALNFGSVFNAPVIYFCQNNQFAISVPFHKQMRSKTVAQKAVAYGIDGYRVDGNDLFAVYEITKKAVEKARSGGGPTLIEAVTYRHGAHTTADDPTRYRDPEEVRMWVEERDPIKRLRTFLTKRGLWNDDMQAQAEEELGQQVDEAVQYAEGLPPTDPGHIFDYTFAELPADLEQQKQALLAELAEGGE